MTNINRVFIRTEGLPTLPPTVKRYMARVQNNGYTLAEALDITPDDAETHEVYEWLYSRSTAICEEAFALEWLKSRTNELQAIAQVNAF